MNETAAYKVLELLGQYYKDSSDNLASVDFPEKLKVGSNEWLVYVFYSCLLDYGTRSKIYHNNLIKTYEMFPQIFSTKDVLNNFGEKRESLLKIMKENIHPRYPNVAVDKWLKLSSELAKYDNLKEHIAKMNLLELEGFVKNIGGFGQKTGGLLIRLIVEAEIITSESDLNFIPIDRHDIEISYLNGIVDKKNLNNQEIKRLSDLLIKRGHDLGINASMVDKYLWNVGNSFCNKGDCTNCPLRENCKTKMEVVNNESNND